MIRIGRSPLRKAPAGRYGPARTFVAVAPCGGDLSGTCFRCSPFSDGTFIRHLRMLRGTLLSGRSSSGTCARFEAHSSADPYCRELQGGVWLPRQSTFPNVKRMRSERVETVGA